MEVDKKSLWTFLFKKLLHKLTATQPINGLVLQREVPLAWNEFLGR